MKNHEHCEYAKINADVRIIQEKFLGSLCLIWVKTAVNNENEVLMVLFRSDKTQSGSFKFDL